MPPIKPIIAPEAPIEFFHLQNSRIKQTQGQ
jgi:hypothetical protein